MTWRVSAAVWACLFTLACEAFLKAFEFDSFLLSYSVIHFDCNALQVCSLEEQIRTLKSAKENFEEQVEDLMNKLKEVRILFTIIEWASDNIPK